MIKIDSIYTLLYSLIIFTKDVELILNETLNNYVNRFEEYKNKKESLNNYADRLSILRLISFLLGVVLTVLSFSYLDNVYGYLVLSVSIVFFIILVVKHERVLNKADKYSKLAEINNKCKARIEGSWTSFADNGNEYLDPLHSYINDLDIFGHASLFQYLNTSNTYNGREYLRKLLEDPVKDIFPTCTPDTKTLIHSWSSDSILKRQNAIKELAESIDFSQSLECAGMGSKDYSNDPEKLFDYAENGKNLFKWKWVKYIFYILPIITISSLVYWYFDRSVPFILPLFLLASHMLINLAGYIKVNSILETISTYQDKLNVYPRLFKIIEDNDFNNNFLIELKSNFFTKNKTASKQIKALDKIVGIVAFKYNPLIYFVLNSLFFWDYHCVFALEKWKSLSGSSLRKWLNSVGMFEALSSLAMLSQLNPDWQYPEFEENGLKISANDMGHPLISANNRVNNCVIINNEIAVITGSNMSGKTTLLRTIGVNLVLAYAGASVCAQEFKCSVMDIFTSMRVSDDLSSGISTFYAELLRIKMIIDNSKQGKPMIFLIDEVFRGTNSKDRVVGGRNVLLNLNQSWNIGLISTHDLELCEFANDPSGRIKNYHFIETYSDGEIHFDYKLKTGPCNSTNAQYLMKMLGIDIIE